MIFNVILLFVNYSLLLPPPPPLPPLLLLLLLSPALSFLLFIIAHNKSNEEGDSALSWFSFPEYLICAQCHALNPNSASSEPSSVHQTSKTLLYKAYPTPGILLASFKSSS